MRRDGDSCFVAASPRPRFPLSPRPKLAFLGAGLRVVS
jgi:hypothetical protein